jgi:phosphotriesterase-related protein
MFRPHDLDGRIERLRRLFVQDYEDGMEGTGIRPGVIKCSTDLHGVTPDIEALLRASARTHLQTGLPITTHTSHRNESGLMQQRIFAEEGVEMGAVVIGHCNESNDLGYLERLIENGTYIGFDRLGMESPDATLDDQLDNLAELCRRGYADRVMLSHDHIVYFDMVPVERYRERYADHLAHYPFRYIDNAFLPGLRERGVPEQDVTTMLVENPKRYFGRTGG